MAEQQITQGVIEAIFYKQPEVAAAQFPVPVMQCIHIKTLENKVGDDAAQRYRIVLSDIRNYVQCMLATQANYVMHDGLLQRGSIVRVKKYQAQVLKGKFVVIILDLEVAGELGAPERIGNPQSMDNAGEAPPPQPAAASGAGGASFYGGGAKNEPAPERKPQVQKAFGGGGGGGGGSGLAAGTIYPIEALSPYGNKWTIKARVTQKSDIRTWNKASGPGKLFSVNLLDESGEIRATGFNQAVDQFYELLQEGSVYYISTPCKVQIAKKQFSNLPNDYELVFETDTHIEKAEDQSSVPQVRYNFCDIQKLLEVQGDATVDVLGVLTDVKDLEEIISKTTQKPYNKRELTLADDTGYSVRVTIWGKVASEFDAERQSIVAFKGTRVSEYNGRSLSLLSSGTMAIDPDIPEAHRLKGWYDSQGGSTTFIPHTNMNSTGAAGGRPDVVKTIAQAKVEYLGVEEAQYFTVRATIMHIKQERFSYPACPTEGCNKKLTDMGGGEWRCDKCNKTTLEPQHRYLLSMDIGDHTGHTWASSFDDTGRVILGKSADDLVKYQTTDDPAFAATFMAGTLRKFSFRLRAKMETFGEESRIRFQIMSATPIDYKAEGNKLAELIKELSV
ncbi:hypothetical protein B0J18DRAFT_394759 [Chaetomium sp. MPI-SDFR-AT-0129]|nr:hypothetical protein B0J18DRAFT_394759 [Chaetomium sp. MPI-SDFR-AT-0129]